MTYRSIPLVKGEFYHVFNRSIARQPIFLSQKDYQRALEVFHFYSFQKSDLRYSHYKRLVSDSKSAFWDRLRKSGKLIEILAFCLMPNHIHFLLKEIEEKGISRFMSDFQNSYAKFFNTKYNRSGALFQSMFKAVRIETDEQLIHVNRYIHLNPFSSFVIKEINELEKYPWSSFQHYLSNKPSGIVNTKLISGHFTSIQKFKKFTLDQADYQRKLEMIKHLTLE